MLASFGRKDENLSKLSGEEEVVLTVVAPAAAHFSLSKREISPSKSPLKWPRLSRAFITVSSLHSSLRLNNSHEVDMSAQID